MSRRYLLVEEGLSTLPEALGATAPGRKTVEWHRMEWRSLVPERLRGCGADLIVPVALTEPAPALHFFRWLLEHPLDTPLLAVLSCELGRELLHTASQVVDDFVLWPIRHEEWSERVTRILGPGEREPRALGERVAAEVGLAGLVGRDPAFLGAMETIPILAHNGCPVLLTGETGTGKEMFARAIHQLSRRRNAPFIPVDCGGLPDHLVENELFGHVRGAYTDAKADQKGLIAMAEGGTLLLDEVDSLNLPAQAKLLRFLQERTYRALGSDRFVHADVRVITATNGNLEQLVKAKQFRADLFFRLNVLKVHLEPLRRRRGDIELLARHFLKSVCAEAGVSRKTLTPAALSKLAFHNWPGNVRELLNVIQRAVVFAPGPLILPSHLTTADAAPENGNGGEDSFRQARVRALEMFERGYVASLLQKFEGNVTRAAREAKKDRRAFGRLVKKYGIDRNAP